MRQFLTALLISVIGACAQTPTRDASSVFYNIPAGSVLRLNQPLRIAPESVSLFMQHGSLIAEPLIDRYQPYCKFELYAMSEAARRVAPDAFVIEKAVDETELTTQLTRPAAGLLAGLMLVSDAPSIYTYTTHLYLHSEIQPEVYRLSCMHWEDVQDDNYLTVAQMREAMGALFTLELAQ